MSEDKRSSLKAKADRYFPGMYHESMPKVYDIIRSAFKEWKKERTGPPRHDPLICISRKIGVGSYEIAEMVGKRVPCRVYDREILEHLIKAENGDKSIKEFLDERCPSGFETMLAKILREKVFKSEDTRLLFKTIFSIANLGSCIFVGRGAHLILPRERVLAVRLTCSDKFRSQRVSKMLRIPEAAASVRLNHLDLEQKNFFKNVYNLKTAQKNEFDMTLYMDYFKTPRAAAGVIAAAFSEKFKGHPALAKLKADSPE